MAVITLLRYEVEEGILRHQHVGVDVCLNHIFEQGRVSLEEHLVFHDSRIVHDDADSFGLTEKTCVLT